MAITQSGLSGLTVVWRVEEESSPDQENARTQFHNTVERAARIWGQPIKHSNVTQAPVVSRHLKST